MLELHDTLRSTQIQTGAGLMPIAADLTTPTAYHFACGRLSSYERLSLFTPQRLVREAGLHMLQPYERGKIPVVLIHGLGSSPMSWGQVVNELRGDPALRARYQFWSYMYPTGSPFMLSAAELRRSLTEARAAVNPDQSDPAFDRMVLIGHSMGGLLSKLVISESGDALWQLNSPQPFDRLVVNDASIATCWDGCSSSARCHSSGASSSSPPRTGGAGSAASSSAGSAIGCSVAPARSRRPARR